MIVQYTEHKPMPWFMEAVFRYDKKAVDILHEYPGCRWHKTKKVWLIPVELMTTIRKELERL
jgi:hypothetical protein